MENVNNIINQTEISDEEKRTGEERRKTAVIVKNKEDFLKKGNFVNKICALFFSGLSIISTILYIGIPLSVLGIQGGLPPSIVNYLLVFLLLSKYGFFIGLIFGSIFIGLFFYQKRKIYLNMKIFFTKTLYI